MPTHFKIDKEAPDFIRLMSYYKCAMMEIETKFKTIVKDNEIKLLCTYCEKTTDSKHIKIISNSH